MIWVSWWNEITERAFGVVKAVNRLEVIWRKLDVALLKMMGEEMKKVNKQIKCVMIAWIWLQKKKKVLNKNTVEHQLSEHQSSKQSVIWITAAPKNDYVALSPKKKKCIAFSPKEFRSSNNNVTLTRCVEWYCRCYAN